MPQIFTVFQIVIDKDLSDLINKEGHDCHVKSEEGIEVSTVPWISKTNS